MKLTFIGGTGRSGTSITRKLLGCSRDVATLQFEHRILIDPDGPVEFLERLETYRDPYKTDLALSRMFDHLYALDSRSLITASLDYLIKNNSYLSKRLNLSKYSGWRLSETFSNYRAAVKEFESSLDILTHRAKWAGSPSYQIDSEMRYFSTSDKEKFEIAIRRFYYSILSTFLEDQRLGHFIEDSTWNISHINCLSRVFPEAKFVHVYRDPRDVIASFVRQRWMPSDIVSAVAIYKDLVRDILEKASDDPNCYCLKFEKLIENQHSETRNLCEFLDIDHCENIKSFTFGDGNIGRYRNDFDSSTIKYLREALALELEMLGYEN